MGPDLLLVGLFALLLLLGVPVAFCIGLATLGALLLSMDALPAVTTIAQRMVGGLNTPPNGTRSRRIFSLQSSAMAMG